MTLYIVRRVGIGILVLLFMSFLFFALTRATPGSPFGTTANEIFDTPQVPGRDARIAVSLMKHGLLAVLIDFHYRITPEIRV